MRINHVNSTFINNTCKNNYLTFRAKCDIIDEGDYVKISKKKYERDKLWKYLDWTVAASMILYWIYKGFNNKSPRL